MSLVKFSDDTRARLDNVPFIKMPRIPVIKASSSELSFFNLKLTVIAKIASLRFLQDLRSCG